MPIYAWQNDLIEREDKDALTKTTKFDCPDDKVYVLFLKPDGNWRMAKDRILKSAHSWCSGERKALFKDDDYGEAVRSMQHELKVIAAIANNDYRQMKNRVKFQIILKKS